MAKMKRFCHNIAKFRYFQIAPRLCARIAHKDPALQHGVIRITGLCYSKNWYDPPGTRISNRVPFPGSPVSRMVMLLISRISCTERKPPILHPFCIRNAGLFCIALRFTHQGQAFSGKCRMLQVLLECYCISYFEHKANFNRFCHG